MQYIQKQDKQPEEWETWFTTATNRRSYDYKNDYGSLTNLQSAKQFLLDEQHGLCAYCQSEIDIDSSSIEHFVPKSQNVPSSTNYQNLIVVCKDPIMDPDTGKKHCDKQRGDQLLPPIIFYSESICSLINNHRYFSASTNGEIRAKDSLESNISLQVNAFIGILNLNSSLLKPGRAETLSGILDVWNQIDITRKKLYLQTQFNRIYDDPRQPFRQFLLIYLGNKLGYN